VKHLLIGTAVLAIVLTLAKWGILGTALVILTMLSIAGVYLYLQWQEKKQRDEADRRRQEMYARRRAHLEKRGDAAADAGKEVKPEPIAPPPVLPNETDEAWQKSMAKEKFRIHFSLREMMLAMTTAAVMLGLIHILGGAAKTATLLGIIALLGLVVHAIGFEPPEIVVLGWWLILVMYVVLSLVAAMWSGFA
jgi:Ca2+/Na+ antiporter